MARVLIAIALGSAVAVRVLTATAAWGAEDVVLRAIRDELGRSMCQLQLKNLEKPYFIAYRAEDLTLVTASADFGALLGSNRFRMRMLTVEVRVGSPKLDNTNFVTIPFRLIGAVQLPLDDDYLGLRRQLWLATDSAYKRALEDLARKRAVLQNQTATEDVPDFAPVPPSQHHEPEASAPLDLTAAEKLAAWLSGVLKNTPDIYSEMAVAQASRLCTRYLNSEGTEYTRNAAVALVNVVANTQAVDGRPLNDSVRAYAPRWEEMPAAGDLSAQVEAMGERLLKLRNAPLLDRYNGPVLFEGEAAAELFAQVFAPHLIAMHRPVSDNPQFETYYSRVKNSFQDKLGGRVLPDFLSVADDPTASGYGNAPLVASFAVDDDGVPARRKLLVENGMLKTLLSTHDPVSGVVPVGGNRRGLGAMPSNLLVSVDKGLTNPALRRRLLRLVKDRAQPFGLVVERLANSSLGGAGTVIEAYRLFPDGRRELVRGLQTEDLTAGSFKDIVAASSQAALYNTQWGNGPVISVAVPDLLFDDVTLKKPSGGIPKPPLSERPVGR